VRVATPAGPRLVKLRGAAQGTGPLVAELIVAALAEALGLRVPARCLVLLGPDTLTDDRNDELADLLAASVGENVGFALLDGATELAPADLARIGHRERAAVLWLDRLVLNPDRTCRNPNLLAFEDLLWLIDHGAALRFQYDRAGFTTESARAPGWIAEAHVFEDAARSAQWSTWDEEFARALPAAVIEAAVAMVPGSFLRGRLPADRGPIDAPADRRAAFVRFLVERLAAPRAFALEGPSLLPASPSPGPPEWLRPR
jgi:hypothetical protein